jgi:hypothetical protein
MLVNNSSGTIAKINIDTFTGQAQPKRFPSRH